MKSVHPHQELSSRGNGNSRGNDKNLSNGKARSNGNPTGNGSTEGIGKDRQQSSPLAVFSAGLDCPLIDDEAAYSQ